MALMLTLAPKRWGPPGRQGLCSHPAHLWATFDSAPCSQAVGIPGLCSHLAHLSATSDYVSRFEAMGDLLGGRGDVAACGPLLIVPPALKRWGPPRRQGLCSHPAHLWANSDSAPRSQALGRPSRGRAYVANGPPFSATADSAPRCEAVGTPQAAGVM